MEVGIEDCLHIEFEYDKGAYHLGDVVAGRIFFLLVRRTPQRAWPNRSQHHSPAAAAAAAVCL